MAGDRTDGEMGDRFVGNRFGLFHSPEYAAEPGAENDGGTGAHGEARKEP